MKELSNVKRGLAFGFNSVNAGQRQVVNEPQIVAVSTDGGFRITPIVSKLLGLQTGDYVAFVNNIDAIDDAIASQNPELVAFCADKGLEFGSPEALIAIHKEFDVWGIYKGIKEYDPKGNVRTCTERLSQKDRIKFVKANFEAMLEGAMASNDENLKIALSKEDITVDEQINLLTPFVQARELPKYKGSKAANPSGLTGTGTTLTFTDSNVWGQLKADLGDNATKINRVFNIPTDPEMIGTCEIHNGYEMVSVKVLYLGEYKDETPVVRETKKKD